MKYRDAIKFWSLVQEQPDRVVLECVFSAQVDSSLKERVATDLRPFFYGECSVEVQAVDSPRKSLKGKRRQIVSTVKGAQRNAVVVNGSIPLDSDTHHLGMIQH